MRPLDSPLDSIVPLSNSIPSPAASQMSNMSNPSKFIRIISGGRDRGRKAKALKVSLFGTKMVVWWQSVSCHCTDWFILLVCFTDYRFQRDSLVLELHGHYLKTRLFVVHSYLT